MSETIDLSYNGNVNVKYSFILTKISYVEQHSFYFNFLNDSTILS